ncbi:MAG: hypothetical protein IJD98_04810 [Oscillospiraceae bacterium]|nr:hypothetical protein [Oscillospiraceae bacterium]
MRAILKYWKVLLALILVGAAAFLYLNVYRTEQQAFEAKLEQLNTIISVQQQNIAEDMRYADIQEDLAAAKEEITASRENLYKRFPVQMLEEDQIMYVLYLETMFGEEISFTFSEAFDLYPLQDGAALQGLFLTVNYESTYKGFQEMVDYLATDSRLTSVYEATISYNPARDIAEGTITLLLYLINSDELEQGYVAPDIAVPETGKDNIFG